MAYYLLPEAISDEDSYNIAYSWINTKINFDKIKNITDNIICIFSDDDYFVSMKQKQKFEEELNAKCVVVSGKGHISEADGIKELSIIYEKTIEMLNY